MSNHNVAPMGAQTVCVDFDGTIVEWGELFDVGKPFPGVVDALNELRSHGWRIVIWTSRLSRAWHDDAYAQFGFDSPAKFRDENMAYLITYLYENEVPFDYLTAEKVPARAYFDDRAVRINKAHTVVDAAGALLRGEYA